MKQRMHGTIMKSLRSLSLVTTLMLFTFWMPPGAGDVQAASGAGKITLNLRNVDLAEAMEMLSAKEKVNILLSEGVEGEVSVNLYEVSLAQAINAIAAAAGYAVEIRDGVYFVVAREEVGKYTASGGVTQLRTFRIQYSDPEAVKGILQQQLSAYGKITTLPERKLLVIQDTPPFLKKIAGLLRELDQRPKQILIEAKILEVTLNDSESFGIDWSKLFQQDGGSGEYGVRGFTNGNSAGVFFNLVTPNVEVLLSGLRSRDRLRTLSTPKLLALEGKEAEAIIGDRTGYNVTTTIDNVTTTSVEFLETGVILKVTPFIDGQGRVLLDIHPEVSNFSVSDDGIPSQKTTEVTTTMLVDSGQTVFIGGLIKRSTQQTRESVPVIGDIPLLKSLFSNSSVNSVNTELIVLITPYIIDQTTMEVDNAAVEQVEKARVELEEPPDDVDEEMRKTQFTDVDWYEIDD
jgi:type II secretory pathway component GspD/PulD (secretin)